MSAILASNLGKDFGDVTAVKSLNLDIPAGSFFGLLGRNGSGKTTTLQMCSTLIRPSRGSVEVAGMNVVENPTAVRRQVGYVFQETALDGTMTVEENLRFSGRLYGLSNKQVTERSAELLALFDLTDKRNRKVLTLSGGMKRAVDIARGVLHRPAILLLDEPTIGLDIINRRAIWGYLNGLRKEGMTVVLTTHYMDEAADCDHVVFMHKGEIIGEGAPHELTQGMGEFMLDIDVDNPSSLLNQLEPRLGRAVVQGSQIQFRLTDENLDIGALQNDLKKQVNALIVRKPDLNDVYVWTNQEAR